MTPNQSFIEITSFSWFMMIDNDSVAYLCRDASSGVSPKPLIHAHTF